MSDELASIDIAIKMLELELRKQNDVLQRQELSEAIHHLKIASRHLKKWMRKTGFIKRKTK